MRVLLGTLAGLLAVSTACGTTSSAPTVAVYPPELTLKPSAWTDTTSTWTTVAVLNETFFTLDVSQVELTGEGAKFLEYQIVGDEDALVLRESLLLRVRIIPPSQDVLEGWSSNTFTAQLKFTVGGSGAIDPETGQPDPAGRQEVKHEVPISFELECDLDRDGFDAEACGGLDCDDRLILVNPGATDFCDGYDNNCSGVDDDPNCVDLDD